MELQRSAGRPECTQGSVEGHKPLASALDQEHRKAKTHENEAFSRRFRGVLPHFVARFSSLEDADTLRRFVKLLDLLYDRRVRLVIACETTLEELFKDIRLEVGLSGPNPT